MDQTSTGAHHNSPQAEVVLSKLETILQYLQATAEEERAWRPRVEQIQTSSANNQPLPAMHQAILDDIQTILHGGTPSSVSEETCEADHTVAEVPTDRQGIQPGPEEPRTTPEDADTNANEADQESVGDAGTQPSQEETQSAAVDIELDSEETQSVLCDTEPGAIDQSNSGSQDGPKGAQPSESRQASAALETDEEEVAHTAPEEVQYDAQHTPAVEDTRLTPENKETGELEQGSAKTAAMQGEMELDDTYSMSTDEAVSTSEESTDSYGYPPWYPRPTRTQSDLFYSPDPWAATCRPRSFSSSV